MAPNRAVSYTHLDVYKRQDMFPVGQEVDIHVDPFDIQIMNKPASEDEEAAVSYTHLDVYKRQV